MIRFFEKHRKDIPEPDDNNTYTQADIDQINSRNPPVKLTLRNPGTIDFFVNALNMYDKRQQWEQQNISNFNH